MVRNWSRKPGCPQGQGFDSSALRHLYRRLRMNAQGYGQNIDSVQSKPEECSTGGDPYQPQWGVTVFFQHEEDAERFIKSCVPSLPSPSGRPD